MSGPPPPLPTGRWPVPIGTLLSPLAPEPPAPPPDGPEITGALSSLIALSGDAVVAPEPPAPDTPPPGSGFGGRGGLLTTRSFASCSAEAGIRGLLGGASGG